MKSSSVSKCKQMKCTCETNYDNCFHRAVPAGEYFSPQSGKLDRVQIITQRELDKLISEAEQRGYERGKRESHPIHKVTGN